MYFCITFLGLFWSLSYHKNVFSLSSKLLQWSPIPAGVVGSAQNPPANESRQTAKFILQYSNYVCIEQSLTYCTNFREISCFPRSKILVEDGENTLTNKKKYMFLVISNYLLL
jgi:hypothetical protein